MNLVSLYLRKGILFCFVLAGSISVKAQTLTLKGIVKDSLQNSLPFVSIIAKPQESTKSMQFTIADDMGRYKLELYQNIDYIISTSHLGYKTVDFEFKSSIDVEKSIILTEEVNQLLTLRTKFT